MLNFLETKNVGPIKRLSVSFAKRLNVLTGDNGLGKTFFLDTVWYAMTRKWPAEVNQNLFSGLVGRPQDPTSESFIRFNLTTEHDNHVDYKATFDRAEQGWGGRVGRPYNAGLVIYALADGSFCVWDPARNYWKNGATADIQKRRPAFVFSSREIWEGQKDGDKSVCNGLLADMLKWQDQKGSEFRILENLLLNLSPPDFSLKVSTPTRLSVDDVRDIPTIAMPYGNVPVLHASAGIRRILALAYCLTWAYSEHCKASQLRGVPTASQVTFLMDEVEAHLHPRWQKKVLNSILAAIGEMYGEGADVQVIASTHSALVMTSLEDIFDKSLDKWFDFDSVDGGIINFEERSFEKMGSSDSWLTSEAFDLTSPRSPESEALLKKMNEALREDSGANPEYIRGLYNKLLLKLSPLDEDLFVIHRICKKKGFIE
ncbi:AAA family ATPase [Fibrobacter sp.]|uniref:AAA family ATPase n=1 Tax=Fibrobacter sp. TaxID=35828 RepID=UPI002615AFED|nr:AAA family ATPase [Fibrobacter sp.]MDD5941966.1 AAA family ATPase [Fibrobacter sp.]